MLLLKDKYNFILILSYLIILLSFYFFELANHDKVILYIINFNLCFLLSLLFFHLNKNKKESTLKEILIISLALRIILIFVNPVTSDDYFRYLWDGKVQASGLNPYQFSPLELTSLQDSFIYPNISYPEIKTIYPPLSQLVFYLGFVISGGNVFGLKIIYLLLEAGILCFLFFTMKLIKINTNYIFLYSLSPLIIFEFFINAHIDVLILFFLSGFIFFALRKNTGAAFFFLSLSILSKTYSMIFLPVYLIYIYNSGHKNKKILLYIFYFLFPFLICIFYGSSVTNIFNTMQNYMQNWYFNNLIYIFINVVLKFFEIENHHVARLILIVLFLISYLFVLKSRFSFLQKLYLVSVFYLMFSHTVHPWYITLPVLFLPLCFSYSAVFWSGFVVLTNSTVYFYLRDKVWSDVFSVLFIEYSVLIILIIVDSKKFSLLNEKIKLQGFGFNYIHKKPG